MQKLKVITTNVLTGERKIHGPYSDITSSMEASKSFNNLATTFTTIFDVETCREVLMIGPETGGDTSLKRSKFLKEIK